jgi:hypothetical protein
MTCASSPRMPPVPTPARPRRSRAVAAGTPPVLRAVLALLLAVGWVVAAALPGEATIVRADFESPSDGARLERPTKIGVYVDYGPPGEPDRVEVRFVRNGAVAGGAHALPRTEDGDLGGSRRSRFSASFDPMASAWHGGGIAANGRYVLEMRVRERYAEGHERWTGWSAGPQVVVDGPAPATETSARLLDPESRQIEVTWSAVGTRVPDFTRYVVQRSVDGGDFTEAFVSLDASESRFADVAPADGTYRYRVIVHRAGGDDVERASEPADSAPVDTRPQASPSPDATSDSGGTGAEGDGSGDDRLRERSSGALETSNGASGSLPDRMSPGSGDAPEVAGPGGVDPSTIFEETLDYGDIPEGERTITDRRMVAVDDGAPTGGGMLSIMERELAPDQILVPIAAGLVFTLAGLHVRRFLSS